MLEAITTGFTSVIDRLDYGYMAGIILLGELLFHNKGRLPKIPQGWKVAAIGLIYGIVLYFVRDCTPQECIENLLLSHLAAVVLHNLFLEKPLRFLIKKYTDK